MKKSKNKDLFLTAWVTIGLVLTIIAFRQFVWILVGAQNPASFQVPIDPPYFRLALDQDNKNPDQFTLNLLVNTDERETIEADIVLKYDPQKLSIKREDIKFYNHFGVYQIARTEAGIIDFSLFSNPQRGEPTLKTEMKEEVKIATLTFTKLSSYSGTTRIDFQFEPGQANDSNLISIFEKRPERANDILRNTQGLNLSL